MINHSKITVFMAAYNSGEYISQSIQSILDQTFSDFELLIVNDGSTDNTVEIVNSFSDPRIRLFHNDRNRGLTYTRNVVLKEARGEFIAVLDSDDIALPTRLEQQNSFFSKHPNVALCGGHALIIDQKGDLTGSKLVMPVGIENVKMQMLFINPFVNSTVMYKTSVLRELGGYEDYAPAEDYELFTRISNKYEIGNIDEILVKYRIHQNNISTVKSELGNKKVWQIKQNQLASLGLDYDEQLTSTLFSILMWDYKSYNFSSYLQLFTKLKFANRKLQKYPIKAFEKMLFINWFDAIYIKQAKMNALSLLFNKNLFKWSYLTARQFRKAFKLSLKGFGSRSI